MSNNPQDQDPVARIREYRESVLAYEALDQQIDTFFKSLSGHRDHLSEGEYARYKELAKLRDDAYNRMKGLEQGLLDEG
jgi:hypothetical protein